MRTKKEIKRKIAKVEAERKAVPQFSVFGNVNWITLDMQIHILKNGDRFSSSRLRAKLDSLLEDYGGEFPDNELDHAKVDTYDWLLGNSDEL